MIREKLSTKAASWSAKTLVSRPWHALWKYCEAKASMMRSIFCASPGRRNDSRNTRMATSNVSCAKSNDLAVQSGRPQRQPAPLVSTTRHMIGSQWVQAPRHGNPIDRRITAHPRKVRSSAREASSGSPKSSPTALPGRFRPQYFLTRTGVT
jgi:hypothetical protein